MKTLEVEKKYKLDDPKKMRILLRKLNAKKKGSGKEINQFWDLQGRLEKRKTTLRLRRYGRVCTLTVKGPRQKQKQKIDKRLELESTVQFAEMAAMLKAVGFSPRLEYTKTREIYRLGSVLITLDYLSRHGWFLEIEGSVKGILAAEKKLGLASTDYEPRSYLSMLI